MPSTPDLGCLHCGQTRVSKTVAGTVSPCSALPDARVQSLYRARPLKPECPGTCHVRSAFSPSTTGGWVPAGDRTRTRGRRNAHCPHPCSQDRKTRRTCTVSSGDLEGPLYSPASPKAPSTCRASAPTAGGLRPPLRCQMRVVPHCPAWRSTRAIIPGEHFCPSRKLPPARTPMRAPPRGTSPKTSLRTEHKARSSMGG